MRVISEVAYEKELRELVRAFEAIGESGPGALSDLKVEEYEAYYKIDLSYSGIRLYKICFKPLGSKELKLAVRQLVYRSLTKLYDLELPYGLLLGIRPLKLLRSLIRDLKSEDLGCFLMTKLYYVAPHIVERLLSIYRVQLPYLSEEELAHHSLYLCIAFCPSRCYYCSFPSNDIRKKAASVSPYMEALKREFRLSMEEGLAKDPDYLTKLDVLYIGGGTPSALPVEELRSLLSYMGGYIDFENLREFCFEAGRADTLSVSLFELLSEYKVTRLSINPQTMKPSTLKALGRRHGLEDLTSAFRMARSYGFSNINSDLILGLRGEGIEDMEESLRRLIDLGPESITLHSLSVKKGSDYALSLSSEAGGGKPMCNAGLQEANTGTAVMKGPLLEMQERMILNLLKEGYRPYYLYRQKLIAGGLDNIGFAKKGLECVYNIRIMEEEHEIVGLGAGASSKLKEGSGHRNLRNPKDLETYIFKYSDLG